MSGASILLLATDIGLGLVVLAILLTVVRIARGPTLPDRILGLDMLTMLGVGFLGLIAVRTGFVLYIDIAIAISLVGFLSTIAFTRFLMQRRVAASPAEAEPGP